MAQPRALILKEHGTNCEEESKFAFERAGARTDIIHMNDLLADKTKIRDYQILMFPGGFSYGDDTGSGLAWANRTRTMMDEIQGHISRGNMILGICNGFQTLTNLGLLPALDGKYGKAEVALTHNTSARYDCRWVDLQFSNKSPWTCGIGRISLPIAHGEGRFYADQNTLLKLQEKCLDVVKYTKGEISTLQDLPYNPNGSLEDIAGICDESGRVLGLMPHPERAIDFTQLPNWTLLKEHYKRAGHQVPTQGPGLTLFENGVNYFK
ncbi:MAG: phosphoribosylformylglycinamidine synthase I [Nanoarchaeota archaeon]|nr:phosphoribosylformylglycinamidine synthase I [Nanoarchaeota archaeon]